MFAEIIEEKGTLRSLDISDNYVGDEGIEMLLKAFAKNQDLHIFNCSYNCICDRGIELLIQFFRTNVVITSEDVICNREGSFSLKITLEFNRLICANRKIFHAFWKRVTRVGVLRNELKCHAKRGSLVDKFFQLQAKKTWKEFIEDTGGECEDYRKYVMCIQSINTQIKKFDASLRRLKWLVAHLKQISLDEKKERAMKSLNHCLKEGLLDEFEEILSAICSKYCGSYYKKDRARFQLSNPNLVSEIYKAWTLFFGEECPKWLDEEVHRLSTFCYLLVIAKGVNKEEVTFDFLPSVLFSSLQQTVRTKQFAESTFLETVQTRKNFCV